MKIKRFTEILKKKYESQATIKAIRAMKMRPSYENMIFFEKFGIPITAWINIRAWLEDAKPLKRRIK